MPAPVKQRQQQPQLIGSYRNSALRDKEDELGLFLEMKKREKERHDLLFQNAETEFDSSPGSRTGKLGVFSMASATSVRKTGADEFLNSENDKNDYEWLLTPPGTPLFPSLEMESQKTVINRNGIHKVHPTAVKSRLSSTQPEANGRNSLVSRPRAASPGPSTGPRRPSSSGATGSGSGSRPSTPTGRPVLGAQTRAISNPVSKNNPTSTTTVRQRSSTPTSTTTRPRSSTPTSRTIVSSSSSKPTPTARSTARSSTPTSRPSLSTTKPTPRAPTPPKRPAISSNVTKTSAPSIKYSSTVTNPASSPNARPKPWKPQEMPGYTLDAPPNLRTSLTDRPISSMRGRAGAPSSRSSSIEPVSNGRVRRQSCSPSRGSLPTGVNRKSGSSVPIAVLNRAYAKANENVSPGLYGTKMVERVVNMRKLAPPKQDDKHSPHSNLSGKSSSPDSSGFGRSLSKKSLDMAMRHMDIRRTLPGNLRPLMAKIPASSMYSVRSGPTRGRMINASNSPVATSSNASSEMSINNHPNDEHIDDESNSDKGVRSPASISGR
ncbi:hypothetical protein L1987_25105 [Smallanthus sonchifolius]|uniref:Uncharacterized protein n=1 Tax=Smallanthus sonchifolius TaxID=185202 RepID=A0ACB9IP26_9ASTR|nr:hypothetical protein L1987_25105 [Smallanthus sonchifolius]